VLRALTADECERFLQSRRLGRLAFREGTGVAVVPISYAYGDGALYGHSPPGHKVSAMRLWPYVAVLVDQVDNMAHWRSVLVRGHWEDLQVEEARTRARLLLLRAFEGRISSVTAGHGHSTSLGDAVMFQIRIDEITGRAENC
jgi:nitroimidazol reductase NimA-like FMN-containing flavoprotein (pyridoxamine 5'-phosphate oxidase superfamily)